MVLLSPLWGALAGAQDYSDSPPPNFPQTDPDGAPDTPQDYPYDEPTDSAPGPDQYEGALRPYGSWQADSPYGRFWRPGVPSGWQPYADGQWVWTSYGWTWVSYEPWSWTFHYGRWSYLPTWGWSWFPGSTWGPAWVQWSTYGGYVGWAPLSPFGAPAFNRYRFVRDYDFCAPRLRHRFVPDNRVPWNVRRHWSDHPRWPDRRTIERVSRHPVRVLPDRPRESLAPWQRDGGRRPGREGRVGDEADRGDDRLRPRDDRGPGRWQPDRSPPPQTVVPDAPERPAPERRPGRGGMDADERRRPERAERPWFPWPRGERPRSARPADDDRRGVARPPDDRPGANRPASDRPRPGRAPAMRPGGDSRWSARDRVTVPRPDGGRAPDRAVPRDSAGPGRTGSDGRGRSGQGGRGGGGSGGSMFGR